MQAIRLNRGLAHLGHFCFIAEVRDFLLEDAEISATRSPLTGLFHACAN
jgi:hypothetical protein